MRNALGWSPPRADGIGIGIGIRPVDVTETGVDVTNLSALTDGAIILPKLFRRLVDYLAVNDGDTSLIGFDSYLLLVDRGGHHRRQVGQPGHTTTDVAGEVPRGWHARSMAITDRLVDADLLWRHGRREGALLSALVAVAATAQRAFPGARDGDAFRRFLREQHDWTVSVEYRGA